MSQEHHIFILTSIIGAVQSLFLAIYILTGKDKKDKSIYILAGLLIVYALRMTKWISYFLPESVFIGYNNFNFGLQSVIGPLVYFYLKQYFDNHFNFRKIDALHFIPFFLILFVKWDASREMWEMAFHKLVPFISIYWLSHLIFSTFYLYKHREDLLKLGKNEKTWILLFLVGNFVMSFSYFLYETLKLVSHNVFSAVFTLVALILSFAYLKKLNNGVKKSKRRKSSIENIEVYTTKLMDLIDEKIYLDVNLTMPKVAEKMKIPNYLLSQIINDHYGQSFSDFINFYRVEEAKRLLSQNQAIKISSIAYDSGFNTVSAFNLAFKKFENSTPSSYRSGSK
jgi:AraC-like DNA-binding protein